MTHAKTRESSTYPAIVCFGLAGLLVSGPATRERLAEIRLLITV
jgi:hypothetical protein